MAIVTGKQTSNALPPLTLISTPLHIASHWDIGGKSVIANMQNIWECMSIKFKKILTIGIQLKARKNFKQKYEYQRISNFPCSNFLHDRFFYWENRFSSEIDSFYFPMKDACVSGFSYFHTLSLQTSKYRLALTKKPQILI